MSNIEFRVINKSWARSLSHTQALDFIAKKPTKQLGPNQWEGLLHGVHLVKAHNPKNDDIEVTLIFQEIMLLDLVQTLLEMW